jgi:nucleoid-associated protein YgaU
MSARLVVLGLLVAGIALAGCGEQKAAKPVASSAKTASCEQWVYTVVHGDTFASIAKKAYGDEKQATVIAQANPKVKAADLKAGVKLVIPPCKDAKGVMIAPKACSKQLVY